MIMIGAPFVAFFLIINTEYYKLQRMLKEVKAYSGYRKASEKTN